MKITKDEIIKALATEPLCGGTWIQNDGCKTCAVGSLFKNHFDQTDLINFLDNTVRYACLEDYWDDDDDSDEDMICDMLDGGLYLSALSSYFEKMDSRYSPTEETRIELINFVEAEFPDVIDINLEGDLVRF